MTNFTDGVGGKPIFTKLVERPNFIVNEELNAGMLHQAFDWDRQAFINTEYARIFSSTDKFHGKPLIGATEAKGNVIEISNNRFRFCLSGGSAQRATITGVACTDARPGYQNTEFQIIVDRPWFSVSEVITPAHNQILCLVRHNAAYGTKSYRKISNNQYEYTIQLITESANAYVDAKYIAEQANWYSRGGNVANESNDEGIGFGFYQVFESEGQVAQHSVKFEITDKAARMALRYANSKGQDPACKESDMADAHRMLWVQKTATRGNGKLEKKEFSIPLVDAMCNNKLYEAVEFTLGYGKKSSSMLSRQGYVITTASGLREQMESGWVKEYNGTMTLRELEEWFDTILRNRVPDAQQKIVLSCGREFRRLFDRMIKADSSSFLTLDTHFIRSGEDYRHLD